MWPRLCASVAMASAKVSVIFISRAAFSLGRLPPAMDARQMNMNSSMPTNSAATALQKPQVFISAMSAFKVFDVLNPTRKRFSIYSAGLSAEGGEKRKEEKRCKAVKFSHKLQWQVVKTVPSESDMQLHVLVLRDHYSTSPRRGLLI